MLNEVTEFASRLTWRRALTVLVLLLLAAAGAAVYEAMTASVEVGRVERGLALATKAEDYRSGISGALTNEQSEIYESAIATSSRVMASRGSALEARRTVLKFTFALLPWILFALMYLATDETDRHTGTFGAIILGVPVAGGLALLPDIWWPVLNLAVVPILPFAAVVGFAAWLMKRKHKRRVA